MEDLQKLLACLSMICTLSQITCEIQAPRQHRRIESDGSFRLVGSNNDNEGRVQVFFDDIWGTICDHNHQFGVSEASLICRTLGYRFGGFPRNVARFRRRRGHTRLENLDCPWGSTSLDNCTYNRWDSQSLCYNDVGVVCNTRSIQELRVRLVGGISTNEGRLQVFRNGAWGAVCNRRRTTNWDPRDAAVICRQLGYNFGGEALLWNTIDAGERPTGSLVWGVSLHCGGKEPNLGYCVDSEWTDVSSVCTRQSSDVSLRCYNHTIEDFNIRLDAIDDTNRTGNINIYHAGSWYNICDDHWGDDDARVACRHLGFSSGRATYQQFEPTFHGFAWDMVYCPHRSSDFRHCFHRGWGLHTCAWYEMAGVQCF